MLLFIIIIVIILDAQKGTSQADKEQTESSDKDAIQSSDASKGQKADNTNNSGKNATDDKSSPDKNNKNQTSQPGPVEKQTETASASDKSTASGMISSYMYVVHSEMAQM